jgi:hypothetical protein
VLLDLEVVIFGLLVVVLVATFLHQSRQQRVVLAQRVVDHMQEVEDLQDPVLCLVRRDGLIPVGVGVVMLMLVILTRSQEATVVPVLFSSHTHHKYLKTPNDKSKRYIKSSTRSWNCRKW